MAIAVLDLDLSNLPASLEDLEDFSEALVLLRLDGRPSGQALIDLRDIANRSLRDLLLEAADSAFWEAWLYKHLELPQDTQSFKLPKATVAICTRDRTSDLKRCIDSLLAMPDDGHEIVVVDNAPSSDATRELVIANPRVRYIREAQPGLDIARNRALREATHEIIAFTDDDAAPDPLWLRSLLRNFSDPLVGAVTGLTMALELRTDAQVCFQQMGGFTRGFKRRVFEAGAHDPMLAWHAGAGVNMALRRSVLDTVGPFDEALDAGTSTMAGGDSDMFRRMLASGYRIIYDPEAVNWHRHRETMKELERQLAGYEVAGVAIMTKACLYERNLDGAIHALKWVRRECIGLVRSTLRRPGAAPFSMSLARIAGGVMGPWQYVQARRSA